MQNIENVVEAIVFASGNPIEKKELIQKLPALTSQKLNDIIKRLKKRYSGDSGIVFSEFNGKVQFSTNAVYGDAVADVLTPIKEKELTRTLLEVLSTIAYKQPITRLEIDDMRGGTNSEYAVSGLLKAGLIECVGRKDTVGRPMLYGTTDEFLKKFEIEHLEDLPDLDEVLEKIQLIYEPTSDSLFHSRSILEQDELDAERFDADGNEILQSSNLVKSEEDELIPIDIPDFLDGEDVEIIT